MTVEWWQIVLQGVSAIVLPFVFFVWRQARAIREQDLRRLDERLDRIEMHLDERLNRIERQLTEHLEWHLGAPH